MAKKLLAVEISEIHFCHFYNLVWHTQIRNGTHLGIRVKQLLVRLLEQ